MKGTACLLTSLALVSSTAYAGNRKSGELTDPVEILKRVDAAAKAAKAVKFDVFVDTTGTLAAHAGKLQGSIIMSGYSNGTPEKFFFDFQVMAPNTDGPRRATGGSDNHMFYVIDHQGKVAYEDIDPAVMGTVGTTFRLVSMIEFVSPTPFTDEINAKSQELKGSEKIGDQDCYIIHVVYASDRASVATWSFSKKDFLPRRRINHYSGMMAGTLSKTITNLVVDPKLDDDVFKLTLPKGYTKTDDFAPDFLTPRQ